MIKKLNLGELIQFSFSTTFRRMGMFTLSFMILMLFMAFGVGTIGGMLYAFGALDSYLGVISGFMQMSAGQITTLIISFIAVYLLITIVMIWMMSFNTLIVLKEVKKTHMTVGALFAYSFKKMPSFLLYALMMFVISVVISIPYIVVYVPTLLQPEVSFTPLRMIVILFTYISTGTLSALMALVPAFILDEERSAIDAIKKSFEIVKGDFWRTILYLFLLLLMIFAAMYVLLIVVALIGVVIFMANMSFAVKAIFVTVAVLLYLLMYIIMIGVWSCASVNLYKQLYLDRKPVEETLEPSVDLTEAVPQDIDDPWSE